MYSVRVELTLNILLCGRHLTRFLVLNSRV
uniref:Uncharacterized protein n=1 Tax=Anguilla anguilla TaxID=7936 RepID=A0A0E9RC19_ANGAN